MRVVRPREKRMTVTVPETCSGQRKQLDAGGFQPKISSFRLHLAVAAGSSIPTSVVKTRQSLGAWALRRMVVKLGVLAHFPCPVRSVAYGADVASVSMCGVIPGAAEAGSRWPGEQ
jgi:hypothetical protein